MKEENKSGIVPTLAISCEDFEKIKNSIEEKDKEIERLKSRLEEYQEYVEINHKEIERLNNKEEQLIRRLEDLIIVGEQVENEWAVDICKMIIEELKGSGSNE